MISGGIEVQITRSKFWRNSFIRFFQYPKLSQKPSLLNLKNTGNDISIFDVSFQLIQENLLLRIREKMPDK